MYVLAPFLRSRSQAPPHTFKVVFPKVNVTCRFSSAVEGYKREQPSVELLRGSYCFRLTNRFSHVNFDLDFDESFTMARCV